MPSHTARPFSPQNAKLRITPKSSKKARDLINAAVKKYGSENKAWQPLGLRNHGELNRLRKGLIPDTPRIKAAIEKADRRARRAWLMLPTPKRPATLDLEAIKAQAIMTINSTETLIELLK